MSPEYEPASFDAGGIATLRLNGGEETLEYELRPSGIEEVSGIHLHEGSSGENGPPHRELPRGRADGDTGEFFSLYARGETTFDGLAGESDGSSAEMVDLLRSGTTYLQIHRGEEGKEVVRGGLR